MDIEKYRAHCLKKKDVTENFPFPNLPNTLVFKVKKKMFTATNVETFSSISIKCNPETIDELRAKYPAVTKPGYFSERHWSWVMMDGSVSDAQILKWIDESYDLVVAKLPKPRISKVNRK